MNTYTCINCDKQFEDDSGLTAMLYAQYGWARCADCYEGFEESEVEK